MDLNKIFDEDLDNVEKNILGIVNNSVNEAREMQKKKVAENVQIVIDALKKIEQNIKEKYDFVGNQLEKRIVSIKDGRDGINGRDGKDGKDGRQGKDGRPGRDGKDGKNGLNGESGEDGVSVVNAHIDFDGSLIISLSSGKEINVGEVVAPALAEQIKVITNGGGTSQSVLDTLTSLQSQIDALSGEPIYKGLWNASTNSPALTSSVGTSGNFYIVSVAGSTSLDGITNWGVGDWAIFNGTVWQRVEGGAEGNFTTLTATGGGSLTGTWSSLGTVTTVDINGGTIDGAAIGDATPAAGAFTALSATGTITVGTSGAANGIVAGLTDGYAFLSGGTTISLGAQFLAFGQSHATNANTAEIRVTGSPIATVSSTGLAVTGTLSATANGSQLTLATATNPTNYKTVISSAYDSVNPFTLTGTYNGSTADWLKVTAGGGYASPKLVIGNTMTTVDIHSGSTAIASVSSTGLSVTGNVAGTGVIKSTGGSWPSPTSGQAVMYGNATAGLVLGGNGSSSDILLADKNGATRAEITTTGLAVTGALSATGALNASSGSVFRKNALINGDFQIWPEGTSFAAIASGTYSAELWSYVKVGTMVHTVSQSSDVPTIAEAGRKIPYSLLIDCTTADAAIAAGDLCQIRNFVEGYNFVYIAGVGLCLQFWHKHTKTGIYCISLSSSTADRSFVREYTQDVSDTWEFASVLVDASPTDGTWNYTTGIGLVVGFTLACGTDFQGTAGTWNSADDRATSNQVNACDNVANNFRLAGVQLEKGSVATEFEAVDIQELTSRCQRYFEKSFNTTTAPAQNLGFNTDGAVYMLCGTSTTYRDLQFAVPKRVDPTLIGYNTAAANANARNVSNTGDATLSLSNGANRSFVAAIVGGAADDVYQFQWTANSRF